MKAYNELEARFARLGALEGAIGVLDWDTAVMMPDGAGEARGEQLAVLQGLAHDMLTAAEIADLLERAEAERAGLDALQAANLTEMRRAHSQAGVLPRDLVEASARAGSRCEMIWREARAASDFTMVRDALGEVLALQVRIGEARGAASGLGVYDALLDSHDPGLSCAWLDPAFARVSRELPGLVAEALDAQARRGPVLPLRGPFPVEAQTRLGGKILAALGFDFSRGRFDASLHPFCGGSSGDARVTTRYDESDFKGSLMGLLHEGGHALYEQGRPARWLAQPAGRARGMSLHESQSLLVEHHAGLSREFLEWLAPAAREAFGAEGPEWTPDNLYREFKRVKADFIRVDADEATYPAHVLLRSGLERAMIAGDLRVADLPGAFNEGMKRLLGVDPPDDRRGCLQDIHWYAGIWGYFPTYCVGAMIAAQLYAAATAAVPDIPPSLARGDFAPLRGWLRANIHARASFASTEAIIGDATGEPLDPRHYLAHLRRRYIG